MWVEWAIGRFGGRYGHSTPSMFPRLWWSPVSKYLGALGIALPLLFTVYYTYIESWTLAYACFSIGGRYMATDPAETRAEIPPTVAGITAAEVRSMLAARVASSGAPLSRAEWTGPEPAFAALDADGNGALDAAELQSILEPLARAHTNQFLREYQGVSPPGEHRYFSSLAPALGFWLVTVAINVAIISRGIAGGVEKLARVAMPLLFLFAVILVVRVLTWGTPDPSRPDQSVWVGLNFIWEPNFAALADFNVWLAAAGQIFFTLSIGTGAIQCYASYMQPDDDCILTGMTTAATNEFAEVVLGGTIAIPIAVATFGLANTQVIAGQGSFDLGFVAMPIIFEQMPGGRVFGTLWFALLFFAGLTSSVALCQPLVAFLQETFRVPRRVAALVCGALMIVLGLPLVLWLKTGYLDQYDFWVGTFGLVVFSLIEVILFAWLFGGARMWHELRRDAEMRLPRGYYYVIRYVVPLLLLVLLGGWCIQSLNDVVLLQGVPRENVPYIWLARGTVALVILAAGLLVLFAGRHNRSWDA